MLSCLNRVTICVAIFTVAAAAPMRLYADTAPPIRAPLYSADHELQRSLELIYARSGYAFPLSSFPVSRNELYRLARVLERQPISPAERDRLAAFYDRLNYDSELYRYAIGADLTAQFYLPDGVNRDEYHELSRFGIAPVVLDAAAVRDGSGAFYFQLMFGREFSSFADNDVYTNLPIYREGIPFIGEYAELTQAYYQHSFDTIEILLGRTPVQHRSSPFSSLVVSHEIPYLDLAHLAIPFGSFRFLWIVSSLENRRASDEAERGELPVGYDFGRNVIVFALHRMEFAHSRVRAGIAIRSIVARRDNAFAVSDFAPVLSAVNTQRPPTNLSLVGDLSVVVGPGLIAFLQVGVDDIDTAAFGSAEDESQSVYAVLGGVQARREVRNSVWRAALELGDTHYLWGSFDDDEYLSRAIYRRALVDENRFLPLSSPYGPGVSWIRAQIGVEAPGQLDFAVEAAARLINPEASLTALRAQTGSYRTDSELAALQREPALEFSSTLGYRPNTFTRLAVTPALQLRDSDAWIEITLSINSSFSGLREVPVSP